VARVVYPRHTCIWQNFYLGDYFYSRVFGFGLANEIEPAPISNQ
jgi:hypothetical protein